MHVGRGQDDTEPVPPVNIKVDAGHANQPTYSSGRYASAQGGAYINVDAHFGSRTLRDNQDYNASGVSPGAGLASGELRRRAPHTASAQASVQAQQPGTQQESETTATRRAAPFEAAVEQPAQQSMPFYFVPRDGIDREVITADICKYLGNEALVKPGIYNYLDTKTAELMQGYHVGGYGIDHGDVTITQGRCY